MNESQILIVKKILNRMVIRRKKELGGRRFLTMSYAVSTTTGACYVGYNDRKFEMNGEKDKRWMSATGTSTILVYSFYNICAEASALSIALSWGESVGDLVFFAMNKNMQPFNPCSSCQKWILEKPKGVLYFDSKSKAWKIHKEDSLSKYDWANLEKAASGYAVNDVTDYKGIAKFV